MTACCLCSVAFRPGNQVARVAGKGWAHTGCIAASRRALRAAADALAASTQEDR
jgi:hypothetical protein